MYKKELKKYFRNVNSKLSEDILEFNFECLQDWSVLHTIDEIEEWYTEKVSSQSMTVTEIPLKDCDMWEMNDNKIYHETSEFFTVKGYKIKSDKREDSVWRNKEKYILVGKGKFNLWANMAIIGLSNAGTATEQITGLGVPSLSLPGNGPQ